MSLRILKHISIPFSISFVLFCMTSCDRNFYLSENEVRAYESIFRSQTILNQHFDNLQGQNITLTFDNSTGTPHLQSTNLLAQMQRTELVNLETGQASVSLNRLSSELETQIGKWIEGRLELYTNGSTSDIVRLTKLNTVQITFLSNPNFTYSSERQTIDYDLNLSLVINGEIEVNAVNWLINIFTNINGVYPLEVTLPHLRLNGEAKIFSPYSNGGRIRFKMIPQLLSPVQIAETGVSTPNQVKLGISQVLTNNLSHPIDEIFLQEYDHFVIPQLRLTSETPQTASTLEVTYRSKADWLGPDAPNPQIHSVSITADGKLYHARKSNGDWTDYLPVPMPSPSGTPLPQISSDPTLIQSGKGQMELAVTNQAGDLVYSHWRDEVWGNTILTRPNTAYNPAISYQGKPAVAASAPGQAEIIVAGSDGKLWHLRRINGFWTSPLSIPTIISPKSPFRDPVAVYVGNKIVVVFVDSLNHLYAIAFDLETGIWGQQAEFRTASNVPVTINYAPAIAASGEDQVDVVYVKPDGTIYHRTLDIGANNFSPNVSMTDISFRNSESQIPGSTNATPILTASTYKQPELFVRGNDSKLYHNHFVYALGSFTVDGRTINPGWQGWVLMNKYLFGNTPNTNGKVAEFAAVGTRSGKTEVLARGLPKYSNQTNLNFHNEFESNRYGIPTTPWKAVNWRGWEATSSTQQFYGRPAIVAVDRSFQLAEVGNRVGFGATIHTQDIGETNQTYFLGSTSIVKTTTPVTDPLILSTGPGMYDDFVLLKTGKPEHTRHLSNGSSYSKLLTVPAGVKLTKFSAVSYGNGFVDFAASATDNKVYFWRFRRNVWSAPIVVATQVISSPILIHTGAGQLELLGVEPDYHLRRWRFVNNAWQPKISLSHNFSIDFQKFTPISASSWGDGTVDLVVADLNTNKLYHRRIGPGNEVCSMPFGCPPPRVFQSITGTAWESPVLTAFSPTNLNVLTMQGLRWYSSWARKIAFQPVPPPIDPVIQWSSFEYIGGDEMIVGGTADTGRNNFAAIAVRDGKLYLNRNENGHWTGFHPIIGQQPTQILKLPIFLPRIVSSGE